LIRNCQYAIDAENSEWAKTLKEILKDGIEFKNSKQNYNLHSVEEFREIQRIKKRLDKLFSKLPP
jgi:hypothetical protein